MTDEGRALAPCPFCGGERVTAIKYGGNRAEDDPKWWAGCTVCDAGIDHQTRAEAIAAWNTRPTAPAPAEMVDIDAAGRAAYAAFCAMDPIESREPDWSRAGYKVEAGVWQAVARAALAASRPSEEGLVRALKQIQLFTCGRETDAFRVIHDMTNRALYPLAQHKESGRG